MVYVTKTGSEIISQSIFRSAPVDVHIVRHPKKRNYLRDLIPIAWDNDLIVRRKAAGE